MITIRGKDGMYNLDIDVTKDTVGDILRKLKDMRIMVEGQEVKIVLHGKVIDDGPTLQECGVKDGDTLHALFPMDNNSNSNFGNRNQPQIDMNELTRSVMSHPLVRQMVSNPDVIKNMIQMDPRMKRILEEHPEMVDAISDPETMKQMTEAAANPELAAELARISDRSINNIESMPGGNALLGRILGNPDDDGENYNFMPTNRRRVVKKTKTSSTGAAQNPWASNPTDTNMLPGGPFNLESFSPGGNFLSPNFFSPSQVHGNGGFGSNSMPNSSSLYNSIQNRSSMTPNYRPPSLSSSGRNRFMTDGFFSDPRASNPISTTPTLQQNQIIRGRGVGNNLTGSNQRQTPLETLRGRFSGELETIRSMGFVEDEEMILRLLETNSGNINAVIDRLFKK